MTGIIDMINRVVTTLGLRDDLHVVDDPASLDLGGPD